MTSVTIPDSVTSIDSYAFYNCTSLTEITVSKENTNYCSDDGVLFNKDKTELIQYPAGKTSPAYEIPDGVTSIGASAFGGCSKLTSVTIPDSVESIGDGAFYGCTSLDSVTIPDSVTSIGTSAFSLCTSLESVSIPDSVTEIKDYTFVGCTSLKSIVIPGTVRSIGVGAFADCLSVTSVTIPDSVTDIGDDAFHQCSFYDTDGTTELSYDQLPGYTYAGKYDRLVRCKDTEYTISFDVDGGSEDVKSETVPEGGSFTLPKYDGTRTGRTFGGWFDGTKVYQPEDSVTVRSNMEFRAIWNQYRVIFMNGESIVSVKDYDFGDTIKLPADPTKESTDKYDYVFKGWDGYTEGMKVTDDVTFDAVFEAVEKSQSMNIGLIVGGIVAAIAVIAVIVFAVTRKH